MASKWRRRLTGLAVVALLSLALLEIALRLLSLPHGSSPIFVETAERGLRMRPALDVDGLRTNAWGFNDREWLEKAGGVERLAIIGDSFVVGAVPRELNFVSLLQQRFDTGERPVEVLNLGIPAAGPETYASVLQHEALALEADRVVVMVFVANDIEQSHPDFETRVFFGAPRELLKRPYLLRPSVDYLYSLRLLRAARRTAVERWSGDDVESPGTFSHRAFLAIERQRLEICRREVDPDLAASYDRAVELLVSMRDLALVHGIDLAVVLAPDQFQVDPDLQRALFTDGVLDRDDFDLDQPQRILTSELTARAVPVLDLLPAFRTARASGPLYLPRDSHWNERGNELAASAIKGFLTDRRMSVMNSSHQTR